MTTAGIDAISTDKTRNAHNPVIIAKKLTMTNADQMNFFWSSRFDTVSIEGILIGMPDMIPAASGLRLFPT